MPVLDDFLGRFRRVWAPPGPAAGQAGVPEDAATHNDQELADLSTALEAIEAEAREIRRAAESEALAIVEAARAEAAGVVTTAQAELPRVRAEAAAARIRNRQAEIDQLLARARQEAGGITSRARSRMRPVVDGVVAAVYSGSLSEEAHADVVGGG